MCVKKKEAVAKVAETGKIGELGGESRPRPEDLRRYRQNYLIEQEGIALYRALAAAEKDESRAAIFERLAGAEKHHAERWASYLRAAGAQVPSYRPSMRVRLLGWLARAFGTEKVLPIITGMEAKDEDHYIGQPEALGIQAEERGHRRALEALESGTGRLDAIMARERWHRGGRSGSLRAAVFGVNDGLVSNLSLVMGVAGAEAGSEFILLAGVAGLLAGAFSMGAGEYISVRAQRELFERQIALEKQELEVSPKEEEEELSLIYQAKGIPQEEAAALARRIIENPKTAIDTLAREELGLDPSGLGSPWEAAMSSFVAFALGAIVPVVPYLATSGRGAFLLSASLSCLALFGVGAVLSIFTARGPISSGLRMLIIGLLASTATFTIGMWLGVSAAG